MDDPVFSALDPVSDNPVSVQPLDAEEREAGQQRIQRDAARLTAEKIDAIEFEIARDILRSPPPPAPDKSAAKVVDTDGKSTEDDPQLDDFATTNLFHSTLIRVDKETMILFKDDLNK